MRKDWVSDDFNIMTVSFLLRIKSQNNSVLGDKLKLLDTQSKESFEKVNFCAKTFH